MKEAFESKQIGLQQHNINKCCPGMAKVVRRDRCILYLNLCFCSFPKIIWTCGVIKQPHVKSAKMRGRVPGWLAGSIMYLRFSTEMPSKTASKHIHILRVKSALLLGR